MVGGDILVEVVAELGVLVAAGMLLLVPQPHEVEIRLAALPVDAVVDGPEVGHDVLGLPADIGGRVEGGLHPSEPGICFRTSRGTPLAQ